jgi:2-phospho-L-lactate/phosphoenolpyruvate guanylyltransferase
MIQWTALVPMKAAGLRKTRLAVHLGADGRDALSERLFTHVISILLAAPSVARVIVLSSTRPKIEGVDWVQDEGTGLNAELERARTPAPLLIIHGDLPLLRVEDVETMLKAAEGNNAIAPDSHNRGTNALALGIDQPFTLRFGSDSFALHCAQSPGAHIIRQCPGLALDIDTAEDMEEAVKLGFRTH